MQAESNLKPVLRLTVDPDVWVAIAKELGVAFADSYLSGARQMGKNLTPHTVTAYIKLRKTKDAMRELDAMGIRLIQPLPFGHPDRPDTHS